MDVPVHAEVHGTDGPVGKSTYVVMDLISEKVTHVVVQMNRHGKEVLVPLDLVDFVDRSLIHLTCDKDEVTKLAEFQRSYFHGYENYDSSPPVPSYAMPAETTLYHPRRLADTVGEELGTQSSAVLLAVNKGARVLATDGYVGKVDEFVIDSENHQITHFVIRDHNFLNKWIITVNVSSVKRVEMDTVYLGLDRAAVKALPYVALKKFPWE